MSKAFDFGRVFFPRKSAQQIPDFIRFQPLGNHGANVRKLVWYWDKTDFVKGDKDASRKRVADAAYLHDIGKPQKFGLSVKVKAKGKVEFIYSFRGHRFLASNPQQPWVEFLAKGHHDYSAHDICRDTYKLKTLIEKLDRDSSLKTEAKKYKKILEHEPLAYAHELYILEMCDQIEAEIACRFFNDNDQAESRAFMDFTITQDNTKRNIFFLEPWIFGDDRPEFKLTLASWLMPFPKQLKSALEQGSQDELSLSQQLNTAVETWWLSQPNHLKAETVEVMIKRLPIDTTERLNSQQLYLKIGEFPPNPMQEAIAEQLDRKNHPHPAILLKSPTGTGKMEAVLFPALANNYRLFLILPARSLIEDQNHRIHQYLLKFSQLSQNQDRVLSLVIDTGAKMDRWIYQNGEARQPQVNPRRHLYKGNIILTTLDKFLYRYFSFGDKQKSFIFPHRIHRQDALFCFDEAHSYDRISLTNFQSLVQSLYEAGRSLILMTATMPRELVERFDYLESLDFSQSPIQYPQRSFEWNPEISCDREELGDYRNPDLFQQEFSETILKEWHQRQQQSRIIAVTETVRDAVAIYQQLQHKMDSWLGDNSDSDSPAEKGLFLYHGRIAEQIRPQLYQKIQQRDEQEQPYIVVTTRAIEVGCDLNAEVLISQICPPENLIQRVGRCNRRGKISDAKVIVLGDKIPDFVNSLEENNWQKYQEILRNMTQFEPEKVGNCISRSQQVEDYRVVELFSMLHDYVYGADLTCQPLHKRGLIPTRSWHPSVRLVDDETGHCIAVPIEQFTSGQTYADIYAYERRYNQETTQWQEEHLLGWGSAYGKEITVRISSQGVDVHLPPYEYDPTLGFVDIPKIFVKRWRDGAEEKLLYISGKHKAVIRYISNQL